MICRLWHVSCTRLKQFFLFPRHSRRLLNRHIRFRCAVSISFHLRENRHSSALAGNRLHRKGLPCKAFFYLPFLLERFRNNNLFFPCRFFLCFPFPVGRKRNLHNLLPVIQGIRDHITHLAVNLLLMGKSQFHLRRMHIDVDCFSIHLDIEQRKWIFMLHHRCLISVLDRAGEQLAPHIPSIHVIIFKIPVSPRDHRFSDKAVDRHQRAFRVNLDQLPRDVAAVNIIDQFF